MYYIDALHAENAIKNRLIEMYLSQKDATATIPMLEMYEIVALKMPNITTREFNGIVQSMKRAGVIGTAKGGDIIFLTRLAYDRYVRPKLDNSVQPQKIEVRQ
jgi:hypothetical protein